ncbi:hypothetical protein A3C91_04795 [Candidatus Azambacteria bacterium RIFCSPHIGHO2_02_FULL_52_12]|uniref:Glycosyltransferase 2-like domain-containing protein n=1 Tax=Candidatus Azambacteria bacterium RIFCSPLOWO2_01_FULL_46_25 TaxID=1797298 RepID=A0A1F5BVS8_9BACT|nr:MAG: hypothetical protein A3C91_04795 [Candidatus Azambacteria bacterium RIFCSPHIGHO2_02_FULL_52_12]OGD34712.1 MAG: hypothetical protein A2988_04415 [Candidatus Azambacteria bacterium RIFCSPLOWO2_01_FULL_46_25]OGD37015.1 MAG: hypothetical protein A2850_03800 [Candidatus Azambacteria bacterium RIFCSPHIGHO2_01_FULL_51_74]
MEAIKKVTIILVNYNGTNDTLACLDSLRHVDYPAYDIIVVDNASKDVQELVADVGFSFPAAKIITVPQNRGFAGGNNVGIEYALAHRSDYVLLLNNDTTVAPDFLTKLVEAAESKEQIGIVGPKIYFHAEPARIWYAGGEFSWRQGGRHLGHGEIDRYPKDARVASTRYMTGCALLIKAEVMQRIKMMPELYFLYFEDIDWSLAARKAGYDIAVAHGSHVWHKVSQSTRKMGEPVLHYYHVRNALLLAKRHAPPLAYIGMYAWSMYFYAKQLVKIAFLPSRRAIARMIIRGIEDFYQGKFGQYRP